MSHVYWITGLSGAGKTTIGKLFFDNLKKTYSNTVFLDGDILRQVFGDDLGYSREERIKCAMRYSRLCDMLQKQDLNVICCTISMFDSIREWNRVHILNYHEIYVKVSFNELVKRDQKGLYTGKTNETHKEVAGIHFQFEEPKHADLILENNGAVTPLEQVNIIIDYFGI